MSPQQTIAHYRITAKIGEGGMGEVWRATDTKLNRDVAVKVLPDVFAADPDRLTRFTREAQVLASLNHPNIAHIYDAVGAGHPRPTLVMELVEGPTLAERIAQGPISIDEALPIARQIAEALEYAHERGIVHRDLKPANIKITPEGRVKVLDFGLAKALSNEASAADPVNSPTLTMRATQLGMILGTAAYMSPEQAKGKPVDRRADIWAFGVVLAEMLTARQMYTGETASEVVAALLLKEPNLDGLPADTPPEIRQLLRRCLAKDPQRRLRDIGEARIAIEECPANPGEAKPEAVLQAPPKKPIAWIGTAAALAIALAALAAAHFRERAAELPVLRFTVGPSEGAAFGHTFGIVSGFAVSPEGRRIAFIEHAANGKDQIWVRSLDTFTAQPLAGTEGASYPFWSPDSRSIGFGVDGKLKRIDAAGGPPLTLADAPNFRGGTWGAGGVIVFAQTTGGLQRVPASGGAARPATTLDGAKGEVNHRFPSFLPDGRHFVYGALISSANQAMVRIGTLDSTEAKPLLGADSNALFAAGHLLYLKESTLMAQPFDPDSLTTTGEAVPVAEKVAHIYTLAGSFGVFSASGNGVLAYATGEGGRLGLTWVDRNGKRLSNVGDPSLLSRVHLSPDGTSAIVNTMSGNQDIWVFDLARRLPRRFTFDPAQEQEAIWSPDGRTIIFNSNRKGRYDLYRKNADGTGAEELLYADDMNKIPNSWSPDGRFLLYTATSPKTDRDIWVLPMTSRQGTAPKPYPWLQTEFQEMNAMFSPDGKWVAYHSNESGTSEVYVAPFPGPGGKRQVSTTGGAVPHWRADGKEIFYNRADNQLMAASVRATGAPLEISEAHPLFNFPATGVGISYDVSADGQRFLALLPPEVFNSASEAINVVHNWAAGLKK
jgi:Tol biopolymer transport system component